MVIINIVDHACSYRFEAMFARKRTDGPGSKIGKSLEYIGSSIKRRPYIVLMKRAEVGAFEYRIDLSSRSIHEPPGRASGRGGRPRLSPGRRPHPAPRCRPPNCDLLRRQWRASHPSTALCGACIRVVPCFNGLYRPGRDKVESGVEEGRDENGWNSRLVSLRASSESLELLPSQIAQLD